MTIRSLARSNSTSVHSRSYQQIAVLSLSLLSFIAAPSSAQVAVGGFETEGSVGLSKPEYESLGRALNVLLASEVGKRTVATVVPLHLAPGARGRTDLGAARTATTSAGAKFLAVGSLLDQYGDIHIEAKLIDASTGATLGMVRSDPKLSKREQLAEAVADVATKLGSQAAIGGSKSSVNRTAISVDALVNFGRGLGLEEAGDKTKAAEAFRAATKASPNFIEATAALQRVGG